MAHYAVLDENNKVVYVLVGKDENEEGIDWEEYYSKNVFDGKRVLRTSYNTYGAIHSGGKTPFRKNFAGLGYTYDEERDAFIPDKIFQSWILDEETCLWKSPIPKPTDGKDYSWDEETQAWVEQEANGNINEQSIR